MIYVSKLENKDKNFYTKEDGNRIAIRNNNMRPEYSNIKQDRAI